MLNHGFRLMDLTDILVIHTIDFEWMIFLFKTKCIILLNLTTLVDTIILLVLLSTPTSYVNDEFMIKLALSMYDRITKSYPVRYDVCQCNNTLRRKLIKITRLSYHRAIFNKLGSFEFLYTLKVMILSFKIH